jgi:3-hydroxyisobutyrate dehydrogenase
VSSRSPIEPGAAIAFVGLGQMGMPMATNLAKAGYRLALVDTNDAAVASLRASYPDAIAEVAHCVAAISMLPNGDIVRAVFLEGELPLAGRLNRGALVIDMSSSSPLSTQKLAEDLARDGLELIDAPVSGGVARAVPGTLAIMAGGDAAAIEAARPLLEVMGSSVHITGNIGSAHAMKALNNYVSTAGLLAVAEAVLAAQKFGLDPATAVAVLNSSTGMNNSTQNKFLQFIVSRKFNAGFTLGLLAKDLRIALEVMQATGTPTWIAGPVVEAVQEAEALLGPAEDHTGVVKLWERSAGWEIGVS